MSAIPVWAFVMKTIPHAMRSTTAVLKAVARFEFTPSMPIFARIDVRAANTDDNIANNSHISVPPKNNGGQIRQATVQKYCYPWKHFTLIDAVRPKG